MTNKQTRRAILAGAAALPALAIIPAMAGDTGGVDPIFAAIEHHRAHCAVYWSVEEVADDVMSARGVEADRALTDLLTTSPTTVAGCAAVLRHVDQHIRQHEDEKTQIFANCTDPLCSAGATFLATIAAALNEAVQS
ncbi:MAG TPA: hypothetical protein VIJ35_19250 [Bradyrhizobium sp.]